MIKNILAKDWFNIDVYNIKVRVIITSDAVQASKKVKQLAKKYNCELKVPSGVYGYTVCFTKYEDEYFLIFAADKVSQNTISHECYHITEFIEQFNNLGQDENKEASANLNGYINQKVRDIFTKNSIEVK